MMAKRWFYAHSMRPIAVTFFGPVPRIVGRGAPGRDNARPEPVRSMGHRAHATVGTVPLMYAIADFKNPYASYGLII